MCWHRRRPTLSRGIIWRRVTGFGHIAMPGQFALAPLFAIGNGAIKTHLGFLAIDLMNGVFVLLVYDFSRWRFRLHRTDFLASISLKFSRARNGYECTHTMRAIFHDLRRIFEAPLANIQPICFAASNKIFGVEGWIPRLDVQISKHHVRDIRRRHGFVGCAVRRLNAQGHRPGHFPDGHRCRETRCQSKARMGDVGNNEKV